MYSISNLGQKAKILVVLKPLLEPENCAKLCEMVYS